MCVLCQEFRPWTDDCDFSADSDQTTGTLSTPDEGGQTSNNLPEFTMDQIAAQLTLDYWAPYGGARAFDANTGDTLFVDVSALTTSGQNMARDALQAWSDVTGLIFSEVAPITPPNATVTETIDAAPGIGSTYVMNVGDDFLGTLETISDRDGVMVWLTAGQRVTVVLEEDDRNGTGLEDPYLRILDSLGNVLVDNDDAQGRNSLITFQATTTGAYFLQAGSFNDAYAGDYRLQIREALETAHITFDDENAGAYASSSIISGTIQSAFININSTWAGGSDRIDGYYYQTYLHEIGHALGLGHAGNYNGSATYGTDNHYLNDSWQASVMSYFHQSENTFVDADFAYAITPMIADILAIQSIYGTPDLREGDTVYGTGGNTDTYLDGALDLSNPVAFTVFDTGGTDTFDFSDYSAHQNLDLREEAYSDVAGTDGAIGIARGTIIENGFTGLGNDTITGNETGNLLGSGFGADVISGEGGNDALRGGSGNDTLGGDDGFDLIEGGSGNNSMSGGAGGDLLIGGDVTLDILTLIFPAWTPPPNAEALLAEGNLIEIWEDIIDDQSLIA